VASGAWTFSKIVTEALGEATPAAGAANAVEIGTTAGCATFEGATADAFKSKICAIDPVVVSTFNLRAPLFATTNTLIDSASTDQGNQSINGRLDIRAGSNFTDSTVSIGIGGAGPGAISIWDQGKLCFSSTGGSGSTGDTCITKAVPAVLRFTDGSTGKAWQVEAGKISLAANFTNATATQASTALSVAVIGGRSYTFEMRLFAVNSTAAEGIRIDYDGGTATATDFRSHCTLFDTALLLSTQTTAIATDVTVGVMTGASMMECAGSLEVNASGTFIIRAAEATTAVGTLTVNRGSWLWMQDVTP
jgi:hypothetical protein